MRTIGVSPMEALVLPRVLATTLGDAAAGLSSPRSWRFWAA
jgi:hypothetical protein